jgi:hypothetical protein
VVSVAAHREQQRRQVIGGIRSPARCAVNSVMKLLRARNRGRHVLTQVRGIQQPLEALAVA